MTELRKVDVPSVPKPEVNLPSEVQRLREELGRLRTELISAGDELLARRIQLGDNFTRIQFHPDGLTEFESVEPLSLDTRLEFRYGDIQARGVEMTKRGLLEYLVGPDGELRSQEYKPISKRDFGSPPRRATPDELNAALKGLVTQHDALLADRLVHSVAGVAVPSVGK